MPRYRVRAKALQISDRMGQTRPPWGGKSRQWGERGTPARQRGQAL